MIIDCKSPVICQSRYWPIVSDINNVLNYQPVAMKFMNDDFLRQMLFSCLSYFQGSLNMKFLLYWEFESFEGMNSTEMKKWRICIEFFRFVYFGLTIFMFDLPFAPLLIILLFQIWFNSYSNIISKLVTHRCERESAKTRSASRIRTGHRFYIPSRVIYVWPHFAMPLAFNRPVDGFSL